VLWVSDATHPETMTADPTLAARLPAGVPQLKVVNKIDLAGIQPQRQTLPEGAEVAVSAKTGAGIDLLQTTMLEAVGWGGGSDGVFMARERHLHALQTAAQHLELAATRGNALELFAEELRLAQNALAGITGAFTADDLLGEIFSHFCIGK